MRRPPQEPPKRAAQACTAAPLFLLPTTSKSHWSRRCGLQPGAAALFRIPNPAYKPNAVMNQMTHRPRKAFLGRLMPLCLLVVLLAGPAHEAIAQRVTPPVGRRVLSYVPPDQLVSFLPTTPFNEFIRIMNPVFLRVTGKALVDPMDRTDAIGVSLNGIHFIDAFELVLDRAGLDFRESERFFVIHDRAAQAITTDAMAVGGPMGLGTTVCRRFTRLARYGGQP